MPGSLKGRALRDFVGVTGVKLRRAKNSDAEFLSERLLLVLERLGISKEEAEIATRSAAKRPRVGTKHN